MDGFGSNLTTQAVDRWMEIANRKGYSNRSDSPDFKPSISPPPGKTAGHTTPWRLIDPETKRKKRIATYKAYDMEGRVKATVKQGFRWIKHQCSWIIHG